MTEHVKLTEWTTCGGCAAKWDAGYLAQLVQGLRSSGAVDPALLVGLDRYDDAAVYSLSDDLALVSTTDFFPPLVDDPADFGAIAAANACSDVFAMGGRVVLALNISAFPEQMDPGVVATIVAAAAAVVSEAGGVVAGGHTIRSSEPIFGLAVQGLVHPARVFLKGGARPDDVLALSKPLGTGIVLAGGTPEEKALATRGMRQLNRCASESLQRMGPAIHAVTDVTGFGLFGHGWEMAERSSASLVFDGAALPTYPGALAAAERGVRTGGDQRNRHSTAGRVTTSAPEPLAALAYDPQTSGGLLCAAAPGASEALVEAGFALVGLVEAGPASVVLR
ncbi:MAG: selenide, water dikinase SelD [Acidimicrobiales bacterium]